MKTANKQPNGTEPIRRFLILKHLCDSDSDEDYGQDLFGPPFLINESPALSTQDDVSFAAMDCSLADVRSWLNTECEQEQARALKLADSECEGLEKEAYANLVRLSREVNGGMNTAASERILWKSEPRDEMVVADLLAPLRLTNLMPGAVETYNDMKDVLMAWSAHVLVPCNDTTSRKRLIASLHERLKAGNKVHKITLDKQASEMYDKVGQDAILEPSARQLLHALHAYRPETARFTVQDPFDLLVILWANSRPEVPDINFDDELRYLTLKVLMAERSLAQRYEHEAARRSIKKDREEAQQRRDKAEVIVCRDALRSFDKQIAQESCWCCFDKIMYARGQLRESVLEELQDLTVLQAVQKLACRGKLEFNHTYMRNACADADVHLNGSLRHSLEDLDANCEVASNNVQEMRRIHERVLTRTMKFGGHDLSKVDEATVTRVVEERMKEPATAMMMSETLDDVWQARRAAKQLSRQLAAMEQLLRELLDAARRQYREYDGCNERLGGTRLSAP